MFFQYVLTTLSLYTRGGISIVSLAVQIATFVILGISQALRLVIHAQLPSSPLKLYFLVGHLWVNYLVAALGQFALLTVCLYDDWGHIRQGGVVIL